MGENLGPKIPDTTPETNPLSKTLNSINLPGATILTQQQQAEISKDAVVVAQTELLNLKGGINWETQPFAFDKTKMPLSAINKSVQGLYLNTQNAENKYEKFMKGGIKISDSGDLFQLKNSLTNIYARSLSRLNDINTLIKNFDKNGLNANNKSPLIKNLYGQILKDKKIIEQTRDESKETFYKVMNGLKAIELLKKIPSFETQMEAAYKKVLEAQKNVNTGKNTDYERTQLKSAISHLEDLMSIGTKAAGAIKNLSNQPNHTAPRDLNNLISDYKKKLVGPKKDTIAPPAPKPVEQPSATQTPRRRRQNSVDDSSSDSSDTAHNTDTQTTSTPETLDNGEGNIAARDHIIARWGGYLRMRRADGGYFVWPTGRSNAYYKPRPRGEVPGGQCAAWVETEIRTNPFYKDLKPIADATSNTYWQKVAAVNTCPSPGNRPQIGGVVAIDTNYVSPDGIKYGHIGFVHSINSDNSINVISSNAFGEATPTNQQFPTITTYPRSACVAFSRAPR